MTFRSNIHSCQACNVRLCEPITLKTTCTVNKFQFRKYTRREEERLASLRQPFDMFKHKKGTLSRMRVGGMAYASRIYIYTYVCIYLYIYVYIYIWMNIHIYMYRHVYTYSIHTCIHIYMSIWTYKLMNLWACEHVNIWTWTYGHMDIRTYD